MEELDQKPPSKNAAPPKPQFDLKYANRNLVLFAVLAATVMYIEIMLTPSLPKIASDFDVTNGQVSLILALYTVFGTAINPIVGKLGDIYGKKKILTAVLVLYSITVTLTSFAPTFNLLLISRTFQGIGLGIFPLAFSLVREQFPRNLVPRAQGLISAMFGAGLALGLPLGAFVSNQYGWQTNYHIATPLVLALTVLIIYTVKESVYKNPKAQMDYVGAGVLGLSLGLIVLGLSEGSVWRWTSPLVLGMILVGLLLFVPLIPYERRAKEPVLNFGQLRIRNVLVANVMAIITGLAMLLAFQSIVFQLEDQAPAGYGFDIFNAGLYLLPLGIVMLIVTYPVGILISKIGVKPFLIVGSIIGSIGFLLMSTATTAIQILIYLSFASVGLAMLFVAAQNLLVLTVKPAEMGLATSMNTVFRNVGQSIGAPIAGSILSTFTFIVVFGGHTFALPTREAFQYSYYLAAVAFVFSLAAAIFAREVMGKKAKQEIPAEQ
jgi:predicted MFS family arabinose efflux permease